MSGLAFRLTHKVDGGRPVVELLEPFYVQGVYVPGGFRTDFASIPWLLWWLIPVFGRSCRAAVLHDYLCFRRVPRAKRSRLFQLQMRADRVPAWQAWAQYLAVLLWPGPERVTDENR